MVFRRTGSVVLLAALALSISACHNKRVQNPIANLGSKQPDKVLFDRAMDAMKHNKFDVSRMVLQTLINTYPDSEFIARAKLAVGDSWYAEGGTAALAQAESEYKDFITFFPNMPEAAEAQMKIANIHYRQMEKPDRDYTHARRAEEEYRTMILQYPDSKLLPEAMQRLREVQEVLAEREFEIGRFYYLRESWAAAIARLQSLADTYPLYSGADETLFMLGSAYERQYQAVKASKGLNEAVKERLAKTYADKAAEAYSRIVTRYPVMARADDAKRRLEALGEPVPKPTEAAIAQNKAEEASRSESGTLTRLMGTFHKAPDMAQAAKVGDPTLVDPKQTGAPEIVRQAVDATIRAANPTTGGSQNVSVQVVKDGAPPPNQAVPRSEAPATTPDKTDNTGIPELPVTATDPAQPNSAQPTEPAANPAKPNAPPATQTPAPAPAQVNEVGKDPASAQAQPADGKKVEASSDKEKKDNSKKDDKDSTSKKKKKKKLIVF